MDYLQSDLEIRWIDVKCDGSTWNAQQQISLNTDFPALIDILKQANDLMAAETYSCFKERKFLSSGENFGAHMDQFQRADNCRNACVRRHQYVCTGEVVLSEMDMSYRVRKSRSEKRNIQAYSTTINPILDRSARFTMAPLPSPYDDCDEFNLCLKQCDYYLTKCTLSAQYFAHCPEFGFCQSSDSDEEGKDVINENISTNTKQLSSYVESSKSDKRSFESIKSSFVLQLNQNFQSDGIKTKILSTATQAYKAQFNSSFISLQIVSFHISNQSSILSGKINDKVEETFRRKRSADKLEETVEAILILFAKLTVGLNSESSLDISSNLELIDFVKSAKIIPPNNDNLNYFIVQMMVLVITIIIFISSTVRRKQLTAYSKQEKSSELLQESFNDEPLKKKPSNSENEVSVKQEDGLQFFMVVLIHFFLPILSIYPSVYIWYDYQTNQQLAFSPQDRKFAALLFSFFILKLLSFIWKCFILNKVMQDPDFIKRHRTLYRLRYEVSYMNGTCTISKIPFSCRGVSGGVLSYLFVDGLQSILGKFVVYNSNF